MKRLYIAVALLLGLLLVGCQNNRGRSITNETRYDLYETRVRNLGEIEKLDIDYFDDIEFNRVEFFSSNESVARINYKEELITIGVGMTKIRATLYNDDDMIQHINFGKVIVIDIDDSKFIPITRISQIDEMLTSNPGGFYYLAKDLESDRVDLVEPIPYFEGILLNPYNHVISGLNISNGYNTALIKEARNAYIDGIVLKDVKILGYPETDQVNYTFYTGGLIGTANDCYLSNIKVTGEVENGVYVGGLVGDAKNTTITTSSFEGVVRNGINVGGLVGYSYDSRSYEGIFRGKIVDSYVIADLKPGYTVEKFKEYMTLTGGLVGNMLHGKIQSSYYTEGNFSSNKVDTPTANGRFFDLENIYYTVDPSLDNAIITHVDSENVEYIDRNNLKSGEVIPGLDNFYYEKGDFPRNNKEKIFN